VRVEWLILADSAEVIGNKLYLLGGGWTRLTVHSAFPVAQHFGLALSVALAADEVDRPQEFALDLLNPEGKLLATLEAELVVKPAVPGPGRWQFASQVDLSMDGPGTYSVVVYLNGEESTRTEFEVVRA
jgi:hypothetical protein